MADSAGERDLTAWGVCELHAAYTRGEATPLDVAQAHVGRIALEDPALHAFIHPTPELALAQARASTARWARGEALGPLDGIPLAIKDNIDVAGLPCTAGTAAMAHRRPREDAPAWRLLADAGAVLLGKLNMHEAALGGTTDNPVYGRCINPLREGFTPGGSSGGSGAAVAARLCAASLGTDTMGSVRIPASYCGVYGFIPSRGRVALDGVVPLSPTLDTVGPLARSGRDLAVVASHLAGLPMPTARGWQGLRVGWLPQAQAVSLEPEVARAWERTLEAVKASGARLQPVVIEGWDPARSKRDALLVSEVEAAAYWLREAGPQLPGLSDGLVAMLRYGQGLEAARRQKAFDAIAASRLAAAACFQDVDVLLLPTTPQRSFPHDQHAPANQADLTTLANLLGTPALAFPCPADGGLPASCQLLVAPGQDALLLSIAQGLDDWLQALDACDNRSHQD